MAGGRVYLRGLGAASVIVAGGCTPEPNGDVTVAPAVLTALALAELLLPLSVAPVTAWREARGWQAGANACPVQTQDGEILTLSGPCELDDGRSFDGAIAVEEAPDGGAWRFAAVRVGDDEWDGNVSWIRTDGAHNLAAFDFVAARAGGSVSFSGFAASLSVEDSWSSAEGAGRYEFDGDAVSATLSATAAIACEALGSAAWETEDERVAADLVAPGCGSCSTWTNRGDTRGEWCEPTLGAR